MTKKIQYFQEKELAEHMAGTVVENLDFEEFSESMNREKKILYFWTRPMTRSLALTPENEFDRRDQERLADFLLKRVPGPFYAGY